MIGQPFDALNIDPRTEAVVSSRKFEKREQLSLKIRLDQMVEFIQARRRFGPTAEVETADVAAYETHLEEIFDALVAARDEVTEFITFLDDNAF